MLERVPGKKVGDIKLYALSTCPWCQKTKKLLTEMGVEFYFEDVDKVVGEEREHSISFVKKWNPSSSFPTLVINDKKCIVGFKENEIREALKEKT
jgi:glutaredoxin-like protein NrdH